jgi:ribose 5-phosphate isomerase A
VSAERAGDARAERALEWVEDGHTIGLGTGRAATAFVRALGARVRAGLGVRAVPTSESTARLARELGIPLVDLDRAGILDVTFDGADEVDPNLDLIKGYGGALVREKIVAAASKHLVILASPEKLVDRLGARGRLPVEVVPFGVPLCRRRFAEMGFEGELRTTDEGRVFESDNGNAILDCKVPPIEDAAAFHRLLHSIPGVVDTGLFVGMADTVIVQDGEAVEVRKRS